MKRDMPTQAIVRPILKGQETATIEAEAEDVLEGITPDDMVEHDQFTETAAAVVVSDAPPLDVSVEQDKVSGAGKGGRNVHDDLHTGAPAEHVQTAADAKHQDTAEDTGAQKMVVDDSMVEAGEEKIKSGGTNIPETAEIDHTLVVTSLEAEKRGPEEASEPPAKKSKTTHEA